MLKIKALIEGVWHDSLAYTPAVRSALANSSTNGFHDRVTADGSSGFAAKRGRYHLYVSYACPWAHRTILYRRLKRLENAMSLSVLHPRWAGPGGWRFADSDLSTVDHAGGRRFLYDVYRAALPDYTGRVTVPVLWDRQRETIVNNESREIMRMLNSAFDAWGDASVDFYPRAMRPAIDGLNAWLIPAVCQGVYRAGFADSQAAHERAVRTLFESLDELEARLARQPYLLGNRVTESDWHLFPTLCRFDAVYVGALKCNLRRLIDYPALSAYARRLHEIPGVAETVRFKHIKAHYYDALGEIDPTIVASGPAVDYRTDRIVAAGAAGAPSEAFRREVLDLHAFLEGWLKGSVKDNGAGPWRLREALAEDFTVVHPSGVREDKPGVVQNFAAAYATRPDGYALQISDLSLRPLGSRMYLASYRESHRGEPGRARISTALLRQVPDGERIEWVFLQETVLPEQSSGAVAQQTAAVNA